MSRKWLGLGLFIGSIAVTSVACTSILGDFTTDQAASSSGTSGTSGTPQACTATQKTCNGACVSKEDPSAGCGGESCSPCPAVANGAPACKTGACSFECNAGAGDCDGDPANGCEAKTASDVASCGACGNKCGDANGNNPSRCEAGKCVFSCKPAFAHCSPNDEQGCETNIMNTPQHCGACGHACLGGDCVAGKCRPFQLASASFPSGVAVDAKHVYFTFPSVPAIQRVQRDGKCTPGAPCPQDFAGSGVGDPLLKIRGPSAIVSDGTFVWWTNQALSNIGRRSTTLPPQEIVNFGPAPSTLPGYLALGGGKVWWTSAFFNVDPAPHVRRADLDGANLATQASYGSPVANFMGWGGIATDATQIFWASQKSGVFHAAFNDAPCVENVNCKQYGSASGAFGITVDANFVYWTEPESGTVKRAPKAGGQSIAIATNQDNPRAIAVLDTFVYWANTGNTTLTKQSIRRAPQVAAVCDGVACEPIAQVDAADALVAADDGIYWTNNIAAGGVYRLAR